MCGGVRLSVCPRSPQSRAPCAFTAQSPHQMRLDCGVAGTAAGSAWHPQPRLRPAPGRVCAAPRELRRAHPLGGVGVGSSGIAQGSRGAHHRPLTSDSISGDPSPAATLRGVPTGAAPMPRLPGLRGRGEWEHRIRFIHDFLLPGAPGRG